MPQLYFQAWKHTSGEIRWQLDMNDDGKYLNGGPERWWPDDSESFECIRSIPLDLGPEDAEGEKVSPRELLSAILTIMSVSNGSESFKLMSLLDLVCQQTQAAMKEVRE